MPHTDYTQVYTEERARLLAALRTTTAGGVIDAIQHVGATSVPGLPGSGVVDVAVSAWPFPLEAGAEAALAELGYTRRPAPDDAFEHRYAHASGARQLFVSEAGTQAFGHHVLLREYLRSDAAARAALAEASRRGAADRHAALLAPAGQWWIGHQGFGPVQAVAAELEGLAATWMVAGGWSLDLHLGQVGRVHHDVDVVVDRAGQLALQAHLLDRGWALNTPYEGRLEPWPPRMALHLPRHQVHAHRDDDFIDFLLTDLDGGVWRFRREPVIVRDLARARRLTPAGVPYLAPELVLLFKSKNTGRPPRPRPQDDADFARALPCLDAEQRAWLRWALVATAGEHPWLEEL